MPKTYRVSHYVIEFATGSPKTKGFEERDEMLRFLAITKRTVAAIKINGTKQPARILKSLTEIGQQQFGQAGNRGCFPESAV